MTVERRLPLIDEALRFGRAGWRVLDVGSGLGKHALFLARYGMRVDAIDVSSEYVSGLNAVATTNGLPVRAYVLDIREADPVFTGYDMVLFMLVLHYVTPERAATLHRLATTQAAPGALHIIAAITSNGDFAAESPKDRHFYPTEEQLRQMYGQAGWEIVSLYQSEREMRQRHRDGTPMRNFVAFMLARKPE